MIRAATEADLPAIVAIYAAIRGDTAAADTAPVSIEKRRDGFHRHNDANLRRFEKYGFEHWGV